MTTGYILIAAILILGGVIATVGDRIGTRVGKARLSLFNLRPKNTAVIVTIFTGVLGSASTLAILFAADEGLRKGVFELENIQKNLKNKQEQVNEKEAQKAQVENQLNQARQEQARAKQDLQETYNSLQAANAKQKETQTQLNRTAAQQAQTQAQLNRTQGQLGQVASRYQQAITELQSVDNEKQNLMAEIEQRQAERQALVNEAKEAINRRDEDIRKRDRELAIRQENITQRDSKITSLDRRIQESNLQIIARERVIAQRESRLKDLEKQQEYLGQEVARLEKDYKSFRVGKIALFRGQLIARGVVRVQTGSNARQAARQRVVQLLQEANQNAILGLSEPGGNSAKAQILYVTQERVEQLSKQIDDGREYVVRIFSAGNYVRGEKQIAFFSDAAPNQVVFTGGEVLAATTVDPKTMTSYQLQQRLDLLISASLFRARNAGIVEDVQIDGSSLRLSGQLKQYGQAVDIKAVAAEDTYTAGPLRLKFVVIENGQVIFSN
jgi:uncharacterized protein (DUF3084 family)